jgi:hypothetical protein
MAKTILVVLSPDNNIRDLLQRLEIVVKPGNRIVFLLEYQHDIPTRLLAEVTSLQTGFDNGIAWQGQRAWLSWDEQKARAEENFAEPARRVFSRIGVQVEVDLYWRSLNRIVKPYLENGEIGLILVGTSSWLRRLKIVPISVRNWFIRRLRLQLGKKKVSGTVLDSFLIVRR